MNIAKGLFIIIFILGIVMLAAYFILISKYGSCDEKIVYKYLPRTLEEEESDPIFVSQIFKTMFTQPSVWINSVQENEKRSTDNINKYFISQL